METDRKSKRILWILFVVIAMALCVFIACNAQNTKKISEVEIQQRLKWDDEVIRAYNHLLHRVWLDKPSYIEDVLTESDEWVELDSLLNSHWEDTFEFYDAQDSIDYYNNQYENEIIDPGCIPGLPKKVRKQDSVFSSCGNQDK